MDRRGWEWRNVGIAGRQLESSNMELYQANQLTDQAQRVKSWLCEEVEIRNRAFQEDRARDCQYIEELRRICCAEADRARQMKYDELSHATERESFHSESASGSDSGIARQGKFLE